MTNEEKKAQNGNTKKQRKRQQQAKKSKVKMYEKTHVVALSWVLEKSSTSSFWAFDARNLNTLRRVEFSKSAARKQDKGFSCRLIDAEVMIATHSLLFNLLDMCVFVFFMRRGTARRLKRTYTIYETNGEQCNLYEFIYSLSDSRASSQLQ